MLHLRNIFLNSMFIALMCLCHDLPAQCNMEEYNIIVELAKEDLTNKIYQRAINRFLDARDVCEDRKEEIDALISEAFQMIENDKIKAEVASERAQNLLRYAQYSNRLAETREVNDILFIQDLIDHARYLTEKAYSENDARRQLTLDVLTYDQASYMLRISALEKCIAFADTLLAHDPHHSAALELKMVARVRQGDIAAGRKLVEELITYPGQEFVHQLNYGLVLACLGEIELAKKLLSEVVDATNRQLDLSGAVYVREISPDIQKAVGTTSLTMLADDTRMSWQLYVHALDAIEGKKTFFDLYDLNEIKKLNFATLLYAIHLVDYHLTAVPQDIGAYLPIAYLWEASGFPQIALKKLTAFDKAHKKQAQARYTDLHQRFFSKHRKKFSGMDTERLAMLKLEKTALDLYTDSKRIMQKDELDEAIELLERACKLEPDNLYFKLNLAEAYGKANKNAEAGKLYLELINLVPDQAQLYSSAQIYLKRQGAEEAQTNELAETARSLDSLDARTLADELFTARNQLDFNQGFAKAQEYLRHHPQLDLIEFLGDMLAGEKILTLEKDAPKSPYIQEVQDFDLLWGIADSLATAEKHAQALSAYEELLYRYPPIWKYRKFVISRLYKQTGRQTQLRPAQFLAADQKEKHYIAQYFFVTGQRAYAAEVLQETETYQDYSAEQYHQAIMLANLDTSRYRKYYLDVPADELKKHIDGFVAIESNDDTEFDMVLNEAYRLGMRSAEQFIKYHNSAKNREILVGTYANMSLKYLNAKKYAASAEIIQKGLKLDPQNVFLLGQQPYVLLFIGKGKEAKELIKSTLVTEEQLTFCLELGNQIIEKSKYPEGKEKEVEKLIKMLSKK